MKETSLNKQAPPQDPEQLEKWCRQYGRSAMFLFIGYALLGVLLAVFTPNDILNHVWARNLIGITASVVPAFMDVPARSPIPDVVRFYFGVMWLVMPILTMGVIYDTYKLPVCCMARPTVHKALKSKAYAVLAYFWILLLTFASFYFAVTHLYQPEDGKITRTLFASRFSLATGATLYNWALLFFACGTAWMPRAIYNSWDKLPLRYKK